MGVTFFNSGFKSDPTELFPSIVLVIEGEKRFPPPNFNLKIVRIQRGGGSWILLDAVLHCWEGSAGPRLKNVMQVIVKCKVFVNFWLIEKPWIDSVLVMELNMRPSNLRRSTDMGLPLLTPYCCQRQFVAYERQHSCLKNYGRQFFIHGFWGSLLGQLCTTSIWKITIVGLSLCVRTNFTQKTDDHVLYFKFLHYIC
jgi:hypothetical protein